MKLLSWNINGIRAVHNKNLIVPLLDSQLPDILGLQEVKATVEQNPIRNELLERGYDTFWNAADKAGYSGTAIFTKIQPLSVAYGMPGILDDREGRIITAEFADFFFVTVYTPNSKSELERLEYRQMWDHSFLIFLQGLEKKKAVVVCGDLNVAHREIDLTHPKANVGSAGFTPEERSGFQAFIDHGLIDTFRHVNGDVCERYTWWSNFSKARERNVGWRIDYFLTSQALRTSIRGAEIHDRWMGSDHCPVSLDF